MDQRVLLGVPLKAVHELLGHATIEMTMRYAHLSPSVCRDAVQALDAPAPTIGQPNPQQYGSAHYRDVIVAHRAVAPVPPIWHAPRHVLPRV